jgi:hypothetical protein
MIMPSTIARLIVPIKNVNVQKDKRPRFWPGAVLKLHTQHNRIHSTIAYTAQSHKQRAGEVEEQ